MGSFRLLPFVVADGQHNMAADEVLLHTAAEKGIASLRFYRWSEATVSLGYFQPAEVRKLQPRVAQLPWVRRPSGGKTLVHHHELTYALALPPGFDAGWMPRMHRSVIFPVLRRLGPIQVVEREAGRSGAVLCFHEQTGGDLVCAGNKLVGSAQRKYRQCLLQHGAILLAQSEYTPELMGIKELMGVDLCRDVLQERLVRQFQRETGWIKRPEKWTVEEEKAIVERTAHKYATVEWNERR